MDDGIKPGDIVLYQPIVGEDRPSYRGTVDYEPWRLGDGTLVTRLGAMDEAYVLRFGKQRVHAAAVDNLIVVND